MVVFSTRFTVVMIGTKLTISGCHVNLKLKTASLASPF